MNALQFRLWRESCHLNQATAADVLGISAGLVSKYEEGDPQTGRPVQIPKTIRLAMVAVSLGFTEYPKEWLCKLERPPGLARRSREGG